MQVNLNNNKFKVPRHNVGDEVLAFSYISGRFFRGWIGNINLYCDANQCAINYTVMIDEQKGVPNVPEALIFDNFSDAQTWIKSTQEKLMNIE